MSEEKKTLTYDELIKLWDKGKGAMWFGDLMKHFLVIAMQNEHLIEKIRELEKRVTSMDEELSIVSDMQVGLKDNITKQVLHEPNPKNKIESGLRYQMEQGLLVPAGHDIQYVGSFADPEQQKAFLAAVHAVQFINPNIEAFDLFEFITM